MTTAVLLDIDGTLVDSNYAHIDAWIRAFRAVDRPVDAWRVHRAIGMDSGRLLEALIGDRESEEAVAAKQFHSAFYGEWMPFLRLLPGARELLAAIAERGHAVVLATSAPAHELETLLRLLDSDDLITAVTSAEDVGEAKPDPGILQVALDRVDVVADSAVMIGDAVWDADASHRVGIPCIGVRSGGVGSDELLQAGATAVFDDAAALLAAVDETVIGRLS